MNVLSDAKAGMQSVSQSLARDQLLSFSAPGVFFLYKNIDKTRYLLQELKIGPHSALPSWYNIRASSLAIDRYMEIYPLNIGPEHGKPHMHPGPV